MKIPGQAVGPEFPGDADRQLGGQIYSVHQSESTNIVADPTGDVKICR